MNKKLVTQSILFIKKNFLIFLIIVLLAGGAYLLVGSFKNTAQAVAPTLGTTTVGSNSAYFQNLGSLTFEAGFPYGFDCSFKDSTNTYGYFVSALSQKIVQVDLVTHQEVATVSARKITGCALDTSDPNPANHYAYFGVDLGPGADYIYKVQLANLMTTGLDETQPTVFRVRLNSFFNLVGLTGLIVDATNDFLYVGADAGGIGYVSQVKMSTLIETAPLALPAGEINPNYSVADFNNFPLNPNYIYYACYGCSPGKIIRIDVTTNLPGGPLYAGSVSFTGGESYPSGGVFDPVTETGWFATDEVASHIVKLDFNSAYSNVQFTANAYAASYLTGIGSIASHADIDLGAGYAYFGENNSLGGAGNRLLRYNLNTNSMIPLLTPPNTEKNFYAVLVDSVNGSVYFGGDNGVSPWGQIVRADLATFSYAETLDFTVDAPCSLNFIDSALGFEYVVCGNNNANSKVLKIDLSTFTKVDELVVWEILNPQSGALDTSGATPYLYFADNSSPGKIARIDLNTFSLSGTITPSPAVGIEYRSAILDPSVGYLYFGTTSNEVLEIDLATFTLNRRVTSGMVPGGSSGSLAYGQLDATNNYLYFANSADAWKINQSTLLAENTLSLVTALGNTVRSSLIDTQAGYIYFASAVVGDTLLQKVNLDTFTIENTIDFNSANVRASSAPYYASYIDTVNKIAYFGAYSGAGYGTVDLNIFSFSGEYGLGQLFRSIAYDNINKDFYFLGGELGTNVPSTLYKFKDNRAGNVWGTKVTATGDSADYLDFYSRRASGNLRLAVYDNGKNLLWESASIPNTIVNGWQRFVITPTLTLTSGQDYWLAFQTDATIPVVAADAGIAGDGFRLAQAYGSFPDPFVEDVLTDEIFSIYGANFVRSGVGSGSGDLNPPAAPTDIKLTADYYGKVIITWIDPTDIDLNNIVIQRDHYPLAGTIVDTIYKEVNKGQERFAEEGLTRGETYLYRVRSMDIGGNLSTNMTEYSITIPTQAGETSEGGVVPGTDQLDDGLIRHDPQPAGPLPAGVAVGDLFKIENDSAVYFIDQDNRRHVFPDFNTYSSYFLNFDNIKVLSVETMASIPLGSNVTMRPGSYLIKIQSDPKTYAVEPYGILRWIKTEELAKSLYGNNWADKIVDVSVSFFVDYQMGSAISTSVHPEGSLITYLGSSDVYYIENGKKRFVSSAVSANNLYRSEFIIGNVSASLSYPLGEPYPALRLDQIVTLK